MRRIEIFGRLIPVWLLVLTLTASGLGAAVGTVLAGQITGRIPITVGQALTLDTQTLPYVTGADAKFTSVRDDGTAFTAAIETNTGDQVRVHLYLANNSDRNLVAELTLVLPDGFTALVTSGTAQVTNVTRTGLYAWKMNVLSTAAGYPDQLIIDLAVADDIDPGFYNIEGIIKQVAY